MRSAINDVTAVPKSPGAAPKTPLFVSQTVPHTNERPKELKATFAPLRTL